MTSICLATFSFLNTRRLELARQNGFLQALCCPFGLHALHALQTVQNAHQLMAVMSGSQWSYVCNSSFCVPPRPFVSLVAVVQQAIHFQWTEQHQ